MNHLKSIINEEGITEKTFEYDLHGNIIKEIDNEGNVSLFVSVKDFTPSGSRSTLLEF